MGGVYYLGDFLKFFLLGFDACDSVFVSADN